MWFANFTRAVAAVAATLFISTSALAAASDPSGIWFDHNGRGAVEIKQCDGGKGLCGYVVHVKEQRNADRCGLQILGNVTEGGGGWIYSPERKSKYDVALKRLSDDKLRVVGNAGSRFFSRTFTWTRAPDDIARCGETTAAVPEPKAIASEPKIAAPVAEAKPAATSASAALLAGSMSATRTKKAEIKPEAKADINVAADAEAGTPKVKTAKSSSKATQTALASDQDSKDAGKKRTCTYRIPYVGRTVSVPCRN
jgi:uncharacterized protein (DUF2147 family)